MVECFDPVGSSVVRNRSVEDRTFASPRAELCFWIGARSCSTMKFPRPCTSNSTWNAGKISVDTAPGRFIIILIR
jgi:hypothetical protein